MTDKEPCEHMLEVVELMKKLGVYFGGCGDCGSPWFGCEKCKLELESMGGHYP